MPENPEATSTRRHMPVEEFVSGGYLQEVNRRLLHPLGLALEVTRHDDGSMELSGVWDCRDSDGGIHFADGDPEERVRKAENVARELRERTPARQAALGFIVQPPEFA